MESKAPMILDREVSDFDRIMAEGQARAAAIPISGEPQPVKRPRRTHTVKVSEAGSLVIDLTWEREHKVSPANLNGIKSGQVGIVGLDQVEGRSKVKSIYWALWRPNGHFQIDQGAEPVNWPGLYPSSFKEWYDDQDRMTKAPAKRVSVPVPRSVKVVVPPELLAKCASRRQFVTHKKGKGRRGSLQFQAMFIASNLLRFSRDNPERGVPVTSEVVEAVMAYVNGVAPTRRTVQMAFKDMGLVAVDHILRRPVYGRKPKPVRPPMVCTRFSFIADAPPREE